MKITSDGQKNYHRKVEGDFASLCSVLKLSWVAVLCAGQYMS